MNRSVDVKKSVGKIPFKNLGVGVGLRPEHYPSFLRGEFQPAQWIEVNSEKYLKLETGQFDSHLQVLQFVREQLPVVIHGTSMSLGTANEDNTFYLKKLAELIEIIQPEFVSDHLCWSGIDGVKLFDLLPVPFTEESLNVVVPRILAAQDFLKRPILVENLSSYIEFAHAEMSEWQFISEVVKRTGCYLLLDINNVYVSCSNHGWDTHEFLRGIPQNRVRQIHLAGHMKTEDLRIDTHGEYMIDPVWDLFRWYIKQYGPVGSMIEWDSNIPDWKEMANELGKIKVILDEGNKGARKCA